jgi:hypothetical protein
MLEHIVGQLVHTLGAEGMARVLAPYKVSAADRQQFGSLVVDWRRFLVHETFIAAIGRHELCEELKAAIVVASPEDILRFALVVGAGPYIRGCEIVASEGFASLVRFGAAFDLIDALKQPNGTERLDVLSNFDRIALMCAAEAFETVGYLLPGAGCALKTVMPGLVRSIGPTAFRSIGPRIYHNVSHRIIAPSSAAPVATRSIGPAPVDFPVAHRVDPVDDPIGRLVDSPVELIDGDADDPSTASEAKRRRVD